MGKRILWGMAAAVLLLSPFGAAQLVRPGTTFEGDLVFTAPDEPILHLDLARPSQGDGPFPAIVCIHGGGWVSGDRKQMRQTIEVLARRGYVAIAPDYRLAPMHPFPGALEDCKAAVRWLRANAAAYKIDPNRIGVVGTAAGGHLASLLGVTTPDDGLEGKSGNLGQSSKVQAVVSFFGPTDMAAADWGPEAKEKNLIPFLGGTVEQKPEAYRKASPVHYSCRDTPPFLFLHGVSDNIVPLKHSEALAARIRAAGGSATVFPLEDQGHGFKGTHLMRAIDEMLTFLDGNLKK